MDTPVNYHPEKVRHRKLEPHVDEIRREVASGTPILRLARRYGVNWQSVKNVADRVSYP